MTKMIRDPNCPARDMTRWFGWAFTLDKHARLVGQHNADTEDELLDHFRSVATGPWRIHYWPPGPSPTRRVAGIEPPQQRQVG
jgi:hypothetical protein